VIEVPFFIFVTIITKVRTNLRLY